MVQSRKHFLLVPLPAYGHIIPLLELGKKIAKKHNVTFAVTECLVKQLEKRGLLSEIGFPVVGIPDGYVQLENEVLDTGDSVKFRAMFSTVMPGTRKFLSEVPAADNTKPAHGIPDPVDVVIADNFMADALSVLHDRGIPLHFFNTASIGMTLGAMMITDSTPTLPETEENNLAFAEVQPQDGKPRPMSATLKALMLPMGKIMHQVDGILANSVRVLDEEMLEIIKQIPALKDIPIRFVGPLVPESEKLSDANTKQQNSVEQWLNKQKPQSVVYISFGSIAFPPPEQIAELSKALLQLNQPFILSLALKQQVHLPEEIRSQMPTQYEEHGKFIVTGWAPQKLILQHPAVSVFLSHCGWNSTVESMFAGVPIVAWPMFAEQKINASVLDKRGIAVMVEGTGIKPVRIVPAEEIVRVIREVGGASEDTSYRRAVQTWKRTLSGVLGAGGTAEAELDDFLHSIRT